MNKKIIFLESKLHALEELLMVSETSFLEEAKKLEEANEELNQEMNFNQTLIQSSGVFFVAIRPNGKILLMNDCMLHSLGYTLKEVADTDYMSTFVHEDEREELAKIFKQLTIANQSTLNENRILAKDGREVLVEWHGKSIFKGAELDYFFGVGTDITERKKAEEKIHYISAIQNLILENSTLGIALVRNRVFEWANARVGELFMLPLTQIQGSSCRVIYPSDNAYEELGKSAYPVLARGERSNTTLQLKRSDGTMFWCRFIGKALNPAKVHDGSIWMFEDITQEKLAQNAAEENALQQGRIEMSNNMMHDIGNALTGISAYTIKPQTEKDWTEIMSLQKLNDLFASKEKELIEIFGEEKEKHLLGFIEALKSSLQQRNKSYIEFCEKIFHTVGHISSILELQKYYLKEKNTPLATVLNIHKMIEDALIILSSSLQKRNIAVKIATDGSNPNISGDQTRMMRMLLNILKNTYEAFDGLESQDSRKLDIKITSDMKTSEVIIIFSDNGAGFSPGNCGKLFERGFSTKLNGSGIGLHECRAIIESHGGTIAIESKGQNAGAETTIKIPLLNGKKGQENHGSAI